MPGLECNMKSMLCKLVKTCLKIKNKRCFTLNNENGEVVLEFSRTTDDQNSNSFVEKINYEKVEEAFEKRNDSQKFNR